MYTSTHRFRARQGLQAALRAFSLSFYVNFKYRKPFFLPHQGLDSRGADITMLYDMQHTVQRPVAQRALPFCLPDSVCARWAGHAVATVGEDGRDGVGSAFRAFGGDAGVGLEHVSSDVDGVFVGYGYVAGDCVQVGWGFGGAASSADKHKRGDEGGGADGDDDQSQKKLRVV